MDKPHYHPVMGLSGSELKGQSRIGPENCTSNPRPPLS